MSQTKRGSVVEVLVSVAIGLIVSMIANHFVFPLYGFQPSLISNAQITLIYTVISVARGYVVRRFFNFLNN